ncbi:response regulator [Herpetosiphon geysericola]|uniref:Response regulatory domain-containing protein n=1 Tax=Herpetosiphon geysericola TaxID=70996 RepID=A0A0P6YY49_9CHLR|nr:response regulator [Herpetosiphon geysericola]KPL90205.1 hypothetical protein SE18_08365 [Herpetosiphon geysericola]
MYQTLRKRQLLVIDDSDEDCALIERSFSRFNPTLEIVRCYDGDQALHLLHETSVTLPRSSLPDLILLDLNLPAMDGFTVLAQIKTSPVLRQIPVVILTTSANPDAITRCYQDGANSYLVKSLNVAGFQQTMHVLYRYWFEVVCHPYGR